MATPSIHPYIPSFKSNIYLLSIQAPPSDPTHNHGQVDKPLESGAQRVLESGQPREGGESRQPREGGESRQLREGGEIPRTSTPMSVRPPYAFLLSDDDEER